MINLNSAESGKTCIVKSISGSERLINRVTSIGLTLGSRVDIIRSQPKYPVLIFCRDTVIAINQKEAGNICVEVVAQ